MYSGRANDRTLPGFLAALFLQFGHAEVPKLGDQCEDSAAASDSLTGPFGSCSITLVGLMSRCNTPRRCCVLHRRGQCRQKLRRRRVGSSAQCGF